MSIQAVTLEKNTLIPSMHTQVLDFKEVDAFFSVENTMDNVLSNLASINAHGEALYKEQYNIGYQDGQEEGSLEHLLKIYGTIFSSIYFIGGIKETLIRVSREAIYKIIGVNNELSNLEDIIQKHLLKIIDKHNLVIKVSEKSESVLLECVGSLKEEYPEIASFLHVELDKSIEPEKCILTSELGSVRSTIDVQIKAIEQALTPLKGKNLEQGETHEQ